MAGCRAVASENVVLMEMLHPSEGFSMKVESTRGSLHVGIGPEEFIGSLTGQKNLDIAGCGNVTTEKIVGNSTTDNQRIEGFQSENDFGDDVDALFWGDDKDLVGDVEEFRDFSCVFQVGGVFEANREGDRLHWQQFASDGGDERRIKTSRQHEAELSVAH